MKLICRCSPSSTAFPTCTTRTAGLCALKYDDNFDGFDDDADGTVDDDDDDASNRWPYIGIDLGTMLSADFAAAAVLIRLP